MIRPSAFLLLLHSEVLRNLVRQLGSPRPSSLGPSLLMIELMVEQGPGWTALDWPCMSWFPTWAPVKFVTARIGRFRHGTTSQGDHPSSIAPHAVDGLPFCQVIPISYGSAQRRFQALLPLRVFVSIYDLLANVLLGELAYSRPITWPACLSETSC